MGGTASVAKTQAASKQVEHNESFFLFTTLLTISLQLCLQYVDTKWKCC